MRNLFDPQLQAPPDTAEGLAGIHTSQHVQVFMYGGLLFLVVSLGLYVGAAFLLYKASQGPSIGFMADLLSRQNTASTSSDLTRREAFTFLGTILYFFLAPILIVASAVVCTFVGIRLLRSAGAVSHRVIPAQDYVLLASAIRDGNEKAISEYIRLSSLSGLTGTFTKIGLTGLPLATIVLTVMLAVIGIYNTKFFDLAQLTLGAFIGSYVQRRSDEITAHPPSRLDK